MMEDLTDEIFKKIKIERQRQDTLFGFKDWPDGTCACLKFTEEERLAKETVRYYFPRGNGTWLDLLREEFCEAQAAIDTKSLEEELIQVAALAVAWLEAIQKRKQNEP